MATDQDLVPRMRALLTGAGNISEMKMFGARCRPRRAPWRERTC